MQAEFEQVEQVEQQPVLTTAKSHISRLSSARDKVKNGQTLQREAVKVRKTGLEELANTMFEEGMRLCEEGNVLISAVRAEKEAAKREREIKCQEKLESGKNDMAALVDLALSRYLTIAQNNKAGFRHGTEVAIAVLEESINQLNSNVEKYELEQEEIRQKKEVGKRERAATRESKKRERESKRAEKKIKLQ